MEIKERNPKKKTKRKQIGTVYFRAKTTWNERIVDSSSQKNWKSEAACLCLEMQNNKKIKMLGDIAPIISLLQHYTARLQTPWLDRKFGKSLCYWPHSLNWFQRDPQFAWRKLTHWNSTWVSIILAQLTLFVFEMFDFRSSPLYVYIFLTYPSLLLCPLSRNIHSQSSVLFSAQNYQKKSGLQEWLGIFSSRSVLYKNSKILFWKDQKKETFFPTKKCQYKKVPIKIMM